MGKTRVSSKVFTEQEMKRLEENPNVQHVTEKGITYSPSFKLAAVKAYSEGQTPMEIFLKAGFDVDVIGHEKPKHSLKRWRDAFADRGEAGVLEERRGKASTGRRPTRDLSAEEKLRRAEARIKLLEAENEFLKKARSARKTEEAALTSSERFQMINETIRSHGLWRLTRYLCKLAGVSPSGYYRWLGAEESRQLRNGADELDVALMMTLPAVRKSTGGALVIKMHLEREKGVVMNQKDPPVNAEVWSDSQDPPSQSLPQNGQGHARAPNLSQLAENEGSIKENRRRFCSPTLPTCVMVRDNGLTCPV